MSPVFYLSFHQMYPYYFLDHCAQKKAFIYIPAAQHAKLREEEPHRAPGQELLHALPGDRSFGRFGHETSWPFISMIVL